MGDHVGVLGVVLLPLFILHKLVSTFHAIYYGGVGGTMVQKQYCMQYCSYFNSVHQLLAVAKLLLRQKTGGSYSIG